MDFLIHHDVFLHKRDFLAIFVQETLQNGRSLCRTAEVDALSGIHQFDGKDMLQIVHNAIKLSSCIGTHADMVFLPVGGNDGVAAGGIAVHLILAYHRRGSILRNHETGVQTGIGHKEFRKSTQPHDKLGDAPLGYIAQLCQGNAEKVVGNGKRLAVEVTARDDTVLIGEDGGIVRHRIDFRQQDGSHVTDGVFRGPMHLRDATERIRVLYMLLGTGYQLAAFQ